MLTETAFRTLRPACRFPPPKSAGSSLNLRSRRCPVLPGLAKGPLARFDESSHGGLSASCAKDDVFGDALANVVPVAVGPAMTDPFKCPVHASKSALVEAVCDHVCCPPRGPPDDIAEHHNRGRTDLVPSQTRAAGFQGAAVSPDWHHSRPARLCRSHGKALRPVVGKPAEILSPTCSGEVSA